jgi:hypothetical protein
VAARRAESRGGTLKMGENAKILKNGRKYENFEKWEKI